MNTDYKVAEVGLTYKNEFQVKIEKKFLIHVLHIQSLERFIQTIR